MQRAVIYARYSPGPNQTEQSIEGQVRECTKYAELHDLRIVGTYIDRKISGKTDNRREFQRMIDDSEKHIFDVIILYHTDRFARNRYDSAIYKHKLKENGVELRYATTDIPKGPEGIILESIMEGWAEYYSAELSRKIKRGMRESALKCHSTGAGRCLGYRTAEDKSLVVEPEGAKAVQTVFDMYIKGKSHADICRYLNDCGFRTAQGKLFNKNSITHIIRNKRYIGVYTYDDITIEGGIPAIISKDTFHLAQLEAVRRKTAKRPKEPKAEYLLSGKAFCGHCQKPLVGVSGTGKSGNKWYYYYCQESRAKRGCTKKPVKRDWLEHEVVNRTVAEVLQPEVIQHIAKKCYDLQMEYRQDNSDVLFYELKLKDVRKAIKNTMHAIESGVKTKTLPARLQELENEEEALEAELAIAKAADFVITTDQIEFLLTQFAEPWECESEEEYHRRIIKCFVHKVFLFDDKLLIYYNVSRDGKTREQSEAELLEEALGEGFDKRSSGSTIGNVCSCCDRPVGTRPVLQAFCFIGALCRQLRVQKDRREEASAVEGETDRIFDAFLGCDPGANNRTTKESNMSIHSHVQLPYSILKRFRDETTAEKKAWHLDISSGRIMQKEARKLGTSKGYYSECGEAFWNKVVEDSLAKLNHKIWNFSQGMTPFPDITPEDKKTARRYIKAAVVRSGMADETMKQSSATAKLHSEQANHDALSAFGMNSVGEFDQILERLDVTVLLNCTDRDLVVPRNCFYAGASSCGLNIVAPIFPKGALLLFEPEKNPEWVNRGVAVTDPDQVIALNRSALKYEYFYHGSFVASNSRLELEQLQLFQQAYRAELEAFRCG